MLHQTTNFTFFYLISLLPFQDRDKLQKIHLADAVEGLKRYNARRKLKGAVQALAGAVSLDSADSDSKTILTSFFCIYYL